MLSESDNYKCDPTDNERPCKIYYGETDDPTNYFSVPCKCSLGKPGANQKAVGYCASVIGTPPYAKYLTLMKSMHEQAYKCHTYDRENMVAQLDCNNEPVAVYKAAEEMFRIKHWPYMHDGDGDKSVTKCI